MPYTDQQITDLTKQLQSKGASTADIDAFVSKAKADQGNTTGGGVPNTVFQQSAEQFHPTVAASGGASDVAKVPVNVPKSAVQFGINAAKFLNPVDKVMNIAKLPGAIVGLNRDVKSEQQGEANVSAASQQLINTIRKNKAEGKDTSRLIAQLKTNAGQIPPDLEGDLKPTAVAGNVAKAVVPPAAQHLAGALMSFIKGNPNGEGDTQLQQAEAAIVNDPVGQILPFVLAIKAVAEQAGYGEKFNQIAEKAASPVTDTASKVTGKVTAPFAKSALPETAKAFEEQGIKPPVSAVTKSPFIKGVEALAAKGPFGQTIIDTVNTALNQIQDKTSAIVRSLTPEKIISDENLGKTIQEGLDQYETNFKATSNKIYDEFNKQVGNPKAIVDKTLEVGREVVNQQTKSNYGGVDPKILKMVEKFNQAPGADRFENLKATRTAVGEALAKDPQNAGLKRIYGALSQDMDATVKQVDKGLGAELDKVNEAYATGKSKIESNIAQSIEKSNPERIANNLVKRNSADTLKQVKEMIGPERFAEISKTYMRGLMEDSVTRGKFDVTKFEKNLSKLDDATRNELLNPEQQKAVDTALTELKKLQKLEEAMKPGQKMAEGSQTAFLNKMIQTTGAVGSLIQALFTGQWQVAATILGGLGLEFGATKAISSDVGQQFLTKGFKLPTSPNVPTITTPLGAIKTAVPVLGSTAEQNK